MNSVVSLDSHGAVLAIGLNRPKKKNAFNFQMMRELAAAYTHLCDNPDYRCGVLYAHGDMFSAGLDLDEMGPVLTGKAEIEQFSLVVETQVDPFNGGGLGALQGRLRTKPLVSAIHGKCITAGIELALATDIIVASEDATFIQGEVGRGLMPFGGAVERFTTRFGWGDAMRWLLTGDAFDASEARRIGLVQEVVAKGEAYERAFALACRIAEAAPLGVRAILENAYLAANDGPRAAAAGLTPQLTEHLVRSEDVQEGIAAMYERRRPIFSGR